MLPLGLMSRARVTLSLGAIRVERIPPRILATPPFSYTLPPPPPVPQYAWSRYFSGDVIRGALKTCERDLV